MMLSAPIYILKQQAKALSRKESIPLHQALDRIAQREGFGAWSLLSAKAGSVEPTSAVLDQLRPGELLLLGSRPGQGKTLLSLELAIRTMQQGRRAAFFTLDFTLSDVSARFEVLGEDFKMYRDRFFIDDSDEICADHIIAALQTASPNTLVIIDYLQLLDQRRANPDLMDQVRRLKDFARDRELIIVCLSQIDRSYDSKKRAIPDLSDVRLPNPVDLSLFDRTCFLNQGRMHLASIV
jgi:replicative DNA helicase